jgi:hypothetical protein
MCLLQRSCSVAFRALVRCVLAPWRPRPLAALRARLHLPSRPFSPISGPSGDRVASVAANTLAQLSAPATFVRAHGAIPGKAAHHPRTGPSGPQVRPRDAPLTAPPPETLVVGLPVRGHPHGDEHGTALRVGRWCARGPASALDDTPPPLAYTPERCAMPRAAQVWRGCGYPCGPGSPPEDPPIGGRRSQARGGMCLCHWPRAPSIGPPAGHVAIYVYLRAAAI